MKCHYLLGNYRQALDEGLQMVARTPDFYAGPGMTAVLAIELEQPELAEEMRIKALEVDPQFSANQFVNWQWLRTTEQQQRLLAALKSAGFPA